MTPYDVVIVGAGPGGIACAIRAAERGLKYLILEKGKSLFQGIVDSYPRGKRVYPTIPKGEQGPFPIEDLMPDPNNDPVEEYLVKIERCVDKHKITVEAVEHIAASSDRQKRTTPGKV